MTSAHHVKMRSERANLIAELRRAEWNFDRAPSRSSLDSIRAMRDDLMALEECILTSYGTLLAMGHLMDDLDLSPEAMEVLNAD